MKGSIHQLDRKKGTVYRAIIDLPSNEGRRQKSKCFQDWKFKNAKQAAEAFLIQINNKIQNGEINETPDLYFNVFLRTWHDEASKKIRGGTVDKRQRALENHIFPHFEGLKLEDVNSFTIEKFYERKLDDLSPSSVHILHDVIKAALGYAYENNMIQDNPIENLEPPPRSDSEKTVYDQRQIKRFLRAVRRWEREKKKFINPFWSHYPIFFTAIHTGLRPGELLGMRLQDLDLDEGYIDVKKSLKKDDGLYLGPPKTKSSYRTVKLTDENIYILEKHLERRSELKSRRCLWEGRDTVFCTSKGRLLWPSTPRSRLNKILDTTNLPKITMHEFRHTHATMMLRAGVEIYNVSQRLGHSSTDVTENTYVQYVPSMQEETVNRYQNSFDF